MNDMPSEDAVPSDPVCPITWTLGGKVESWCIKAAGHDGPHYDQKTGAWWIESAPDAPLSSPSAPLGPVPENPAAGA